MLTSIFKKIFKNYSARDILKPSLTVPNNIEKEDHCSLGCNEV
jgi:hypothetical protein